MSQDYQRIATAIRYLSQQPGRVSLKELADHSGISAGHFQRLFCRWVGISPTRFQQFMTVQRAQQLLSTPRPLLSISEELGLSSSSRLQSHFLRVEGMTPGEYRAGGSGLRIRWGSGDTPFGPAFLAMTDRGLCSLSFDSPEQALQTLQDRLPEAVFEQHQDLAQRQLSRALSKQPRAPISLHVLGSDFQLQVWRALLAIPRGGLSSYGSLARAIGRPGAARAVGTAIGQNPVAILIPCHRVIRESGELGGYRWGLERKRAILLQECAHHGVSAAAEKGDQSAN